MGDSCEISSHFTNVVATPLWGVFIGAARSDGALATASRLCRGYSAYGFIRRFLPFENRFQWKVWVQMVGSQPISIEER